MSQLVEPMVLPPAGVIKLIAIVLPIRVIAIVPPIRVIAIVPTTRVAMAIEFLIVAAMPLAKAEQALEAKSPDVAQPSHLRLGSKFEVLLEQLFVVGVFLLEQRLNLEGWNRPWRLR